MVASRPPGYLLTPQPGQSDADTFTDLATRAQQTQDPQTRAGILAEALALWRGRAYADFADAEFVRSAARRLDPVAALVDYLADRQLLIVVDNCEHLVEDCAALVSTLIGAAPQLRILATSREPLGIAGAREDLAFDASGVAGGAADHAGSRNQIV